MCLNFESFESESVLKRMTYTRTLSRMVFTAVVFGVQAVLHVHVAP